MKRLGIIIIVILLSGAVVAQDIKAERKAAKKARKEEQLRIALDNSSQLKEIISTKMFVLEAHTLYGKGGMMFNINATTNFVGFDGENSTIQLAFNQIVGWNGVGGITLDGRITKLEIKEKPGKPNFTVNVNVINNAGGLVTMIFRVSSDGNATVDMSGNFGEKLTFRGRIVALAASNVYKGVPMY